MKIEEITKEALGKAENGEINSLRMRANQIFVRHFKDTGSESWQGITKVALFEGYANVIKEAQSRGIKYKIPMPLDRLVFSAMLKRKLWGIEIENLEDVILTSGYVSIIGKFVEQPRETDKVEVALFNEDFESKVRKTIHDIVRKETGKSPDIKWPEGTTASNLTHIPLYDLVLRVRRDIKRMPGRSKEEENSDMIEVARCAFCKAEAKWVYAEDGDDKHLSVCHKHRLRARAQFEKKKVKPKVVLMKDFKPPIAWPDEKLIETIEKTAEFDIKKPFPNEHSARLQDPGKYDNWRRTKDGFLYGKNIKVPANVSIIWGHPKGQAPRLWVPQSLRFPKDSYTVAQAKKWLSDNEVKYTGFETATTKAEENLETFEYLIHHVEVDDNKEIVHHCNMYDHIANLFEQSHLWIDKGKIFLDGKEIKEGHYHVIKGLEPTQEIAWSEKEATDANIKPKRMMSGMTLKEKAKVW